MTNERMKFMQTDQGKPLRVECYICPPKLRIDKDRGRLMTLIFSVKLDANIANACDEKIRRAFEDVTFLEREIETVTLRSIVENTDIEFYELPEGKGSMKPLVVLRDVELFAIYVERAKSENYLYFQLEVPLVHFGGIGYSFQDRFGTVLFGEFRPSQRAMLFPKDVTDLSAKEAQQPLSPSARDIAADIIADPKILQAAADMVRPLLAKDGAAELTIEFMGDKVTIDRERAAMIVATADRVNKKSRGKNAQ